MLRVSSPTMFSWHGVIVPPEIESEYQQVIDKLIFGPRRDLRYKKLKGYDNLITVRANKKHRLLFTTVIHNGMPYLNFCGVMLKHKHSRVEEDVVAPTAIAESAFLQPGVLEHFRQANAPMLTEAELTKEHFVSVSEEQCGLPPVMEKREHRIGKTDFNKTKFIVLDSNQQGIAEATVNSRVVVMGDAGSGKTCVIMAHLTRHAENHLLNDDDIEKPNAINVKPVVCVVKSSRLCAFLKKSWSLSPIGQRYTKGQVQFQVYSDLIREKDKNASKRTEVGRNEFETYMIDQIAAKQRSCKLNKNEQVLSHHFLTNVDYYQEIRIVAALENYRDYEAQGARQSQVKKEDRAWFYEICKKYQDNLDDNALIDFALYQTSLTTLFSLVVADEAGDYTRREINTLCKLSENSNVLLCYDQNQRLDDGKDQLDDYKAELNAKDGKMPPVIKLTHTYRCGRVIADMANQVSTIRYKLTKRKLDSMQVAPSVMHDGYVEILTELSPDKLHELKALATLSNFAVITSEEHKNAAMSEFGTKEVYTVKEMKGLDCDNLVIYRLMERQSFYEANKALSTGEQHEKFILDWNEYYTACTRAVQRLYLVETAKNKLKHIITEFRKALPVVATEKPKSYNDEEIQNILLNDLRKHAANGDIKQARVVGEDPRLKMTREAVEKVIHAVAPILPEVEERPVATIIKTKSETSSSVKSKKSRKKNNATKRAVVPTKAAVSAVPAALFSTKKIEHKTAKPDEIFDSASLLKTSYTVAELEEIALLRADTKYLTVKLNDIFIIPNSITYLFNTPLLKDGDNLFTLLLDNSVTRKVILTMILPRHFVKLMPYLTKSVLNRGKTGGSTPVTRMPPLFWICHSEVTLGLLQQNSEFVKFWHLENFSSLMTVVESDCPLNGTSGLHWLAVHHTSHRALAKLVKVDNLGQHVPGNLLLSKRKDNVFSAEVEFSIFDYLLSSGESGINILIDLFTQQPDLAYQLKLEHLFPLPEVSEKSQPLLTAVIESKRGKDFLQKVQQQNTEFAPFLLTDVTPVECAALLRTMKPVIRNTATKHDHILNLLRGIREPDVSKRKDLYRSLEVLITDERSMNSWQHYLFNITVIGDAKSEYYGETLFFNLMSEADTRPDMCRLIMQYQALMRPHISIFALGGLTKQCINTPFAWMIHSAVLRKVLMNWLHGNPILAKMFTTTFLTEQYPYEEYEQSGLLKAYEQDGSERYELIPGNHVSLYKIMALSASGRAMLNLILKSKINNTSDMILYELTDDSYIDPATNEKYSVLDYLTADESRLPCAFSLLQISSSEVNIAAPDDVICKGLYENNPNKTPIIKNLFRFSNGFTILLMFANIMVHSRLQITEFLFKVFYTDTTANDEIIGLYESLMDNLIKAYSDSGVLAILLNSLLQRNPEVANKLNMDLFEFPVKFHNGDNQFRQKRLARHLVATGPGRELLKTINELGASNKLQQRL